MPLSIAVAWRAARALPGWAKLSPGLAFCLAIAGVALASAAGLSSGDIPIPDSRFPTYVKFAADTKNEGHFSNQARVEVRRDVPTAPFFFAGFFRPEDFTTFGMLVSFGNQGGRGNGLIGLTTQGNALLSFEWAGNGWQPLNYGPVIWPTGSVMLGQWSYIALVLKSPSSRDIIMDGVTGKDTGNNLPWPAADALGSGLAVTFGSYYNTTQTNGIDAHNFNGGLRDWAAVKGIPTNAELERMRNGESPVSIWGAARVWGYWRFTANPQQGQKEPDVTGNGHDLSYTDAGTQTGHTLPILVTPAAPARPTPPMSP